MTFAQQVAGRLQYLPVILVSSYVLFIALILNPQIQAHNVFLHSINIPFHHDLSRPERIKALPHGRVRNFQVKAIDGVRISGWHLLPDDYDLDKNRSQEALFDQAIHDRATLIYFHGNAMNRAAPFRIQAYAMFTALGFNVVAIDYRGFGDSQGSPSEEGLQRDARATYKWVRQRQQQQESPTAGDNSGHSSAVHLAGQSLGTGVAARLALDLSRIGKPPHTVFLIAPYSSIRNLLTSYKIGGFLPLFWPLGFSQSLSDLADKYLYTRFESYKALYQLIRRGPLDGADEIKEYGNLDFTLSDADLAQELGLSAFNHESKEARVPPPNIIVAHSDDDAVIPHAHGRSLFDTINLALSQSGVEREVIEKGQKWGSTLTLRDEEAHRSFVLVKSHKGGHNGVPQHAVQIFNSIATTTQV